MITAVFIGGPRDGWRLQLAERQPTYTVAMTAPPPMLPPSAEVPLVTTENYIYREYPRLGLRDIIVFIPNSLEGEPWEYLLEQLLTGYAPQHILEGHL